MAQETEGRLHETESPDDLAPTVRIEPCATFLADDASAWTVCDACGWLEEDHTPVAPAIVRQLPPRAVHIPERMAS
jgi:hypothetical protein